MHTPQTSAPDTQGGHACTGVKPHPLGVTGKESDPVRTEGEDPRPGRAAWGC